MRALTLAAREKLDNLIWVVNCNLQRLDGPVRGNGRIIDELEKLFAGAGWNVIKLRVGQRLGRPVRARPRPARWCAPSRTRSTASSRPSRPRTAASTASIFFGQNDGARARWSHGMTDEQIDRLQRGGHDLVKIHAAYRRRRRAPPASRR